MRTFQLLTMSAVVTAIALGFPIVARAQSVSQPGVDVPRLDIAATARFTQIADAGGNRRWTGPGFALSLDRNAGDHLAAAVQVETDFHHPTALLGGAQVSTGFFSGSGRDPVPGRFFARALAGVVDGEFDGMHPAARVGAGADLLLSRTRPIGLRWEVGYDLTAGPATGHSTGRVAIGLIFGPRLQQVTEKPATRGER